MARLTSLTLASATFVCLVTGISLPPPTGPYNVGSKPYVLNHTTLNDPIAPNNISTSILVNVYYPTHDSAPLQKYIWRGLAATYETYYKLPPGTFGNTTANIAYNATPLKHAECVKLKLPTLLFGPPFAGPASQMFFALISEVVSRGYTVVSVDHPYEQPYLQYPDGTSFLGHSVDWSPGPEVYIPTEVYRVTENSAVLDALPSISRHLKLSLNITHFAFFGHSLGGSAALAQIPTERNRTSSRHKKFLGTIDLDGTVFGRASANDSSVDVHAPTLLFASSSHERLYDPTWPVFESWQTSWRKEIRALGNINHTDFSDLIFLKQANGISGGGAAIPATRFLNVTRTFVGAFFEMLIGGGEGVLTGDAQVQREWPEVVFEFNGTGNPCASEFEILCWEPNALPE
ncbi:uncharacterized protein K460DRAFT_413159 [Cucurbitaria berberidis CBS 394.84]|uniref:1-alkyl-2-acetylglycerophosphocholine esterase n=1 Tax=Cucurbitaria berberidis CBS 394.84 TaxID=1168544 RepID=A0A9P4LEQ9_9PLEO|nr:uncharacterized protein K460DRAFT_413159 [Cucurbitaria berberidis CBS 394.84]KAF1851617.1 hypothetical protein K460DRAFT_413159 [Cucurbitaria berberidis CBS 394.84]